MTLFSNLLILVFFTFALSSCKQGDPEISNARTLPGFILDQNAFAVSNKSDPAFVLTGKCLTHFSSIEVSFDGGVNWKPASSLALAAAINCGTTGKFRLDFSAGMQTVFAPGSEAALGRFSFRAVSDMGFSDIRPLAISQRQESAVILAGTHSTTSGGRILTGRVGGSLSAQTSTTNFHLRGAVKTQ